MGESKEFVQKVRLLSFPFPSRLPALSAVEDSVLMRVMIVQAWQTAANGPSATGAGSGGGGGGGGGGGFSGAGGFSDDYDYAGGGGTPGGAPGGWGGGGDEIDLDGESD